MPQYDINLPNRNCRGGGFQSREGGVPQFGEFLIELGHQIRGPRFQNMDNEDVDQSHHNGSPQPIRGRPSRGPFHGFQFVDQVDNKPVPLGRVIKQLHKEVEKAEESYLQFMNAFENDVSAVKSYAGKELLKKLWKAKMRGKTDGEGSDDGEDEADDHQRELALRANHLLEAMERALRFKPNTEARFPPNEAIEEKTGRTNNLLTKISLAQSQIIVLSAEALEGKQACRALLSDLNLLKIAVDPKAATNKDLFRASGRNDGDEEGGNH